VHRCPQPTLAFFTSSLRKVRNGCWKRSSTTAFKWCQLSDLSDSVRLRLLLGNSVGAGPATYRSPNSTCARPAAPSACAAQGSKIRQRREQHRHGMSRVGPGSQRHSPPSLSPNVVSPPRLSEASRKLWPRASCCSRQRGAA
jgi:hypothetical protein